MKTIWKYILEHKAMLGLTLFLATVSSVFSLLDPQFGRLIIDRYGSHADTLSRAQFISGVAILLLGYIGVSLVSRVAKNFQDYYMNTVVLRVGTKLYSRSVAHAFSLPYFVFEDASSGELLSKLQRARTDAQTLIGSFINTIFVAFVGILFVAVYAFTVHWSIGLYYLLIIPVLGAIAFSITKKIKSASQTIVRETSSLAGSTTETIRNVELVKSLGLESQEIDRLNNTNEKILSLELKKIKIIRTLSFVQGTLINALRAGLMFLLLILIFKRVMTVGEYFTLLIYSFAIFNPLTALGDIASQYQQALASMGEVEAILNAPKAHVPENPQHIGPLESIKFEDVSFSYENKNDADADDTLKNISLNIENGETVAFVGPSGSGKTTMLKLMTGLYSPNVGSLMINGVSSDEIDFETFRRRIGLVSQETQLFAGTIRENLVFVKSDATDEECLKALKLSSAMSILERGSANGARGLDSKIGEGGLKLSGGERQRLAIARALLRNPELIIFDEATSALDSITEKAITKTIQDIEQYQKNAITILVAHRLSTIAHAKRIYVLEKGKIIETGTHSELLQKSGLYSALWREQQAQS
jgi:ATP-binding cassette, subfamily B, bacterial